MKAVIKRFHEQTDFWWWDSSAKDVGTRIFPIVGGRHRDTGKRVRLLQSRDNVIPLRPWFQQLALAGIESATTTVQGINVPGANPMALRRLMDGENVGHREFLAELRGAPSLLRSLTAH